MFKPGMILKIEVTHFVTFTHAEVFPGPNLNMLIGSNGTGKSTIVAAIILGLGGSPKTVGRGAKVSEYVKHGFETSSINITLQHDNPKKSFVITREFNKSDHTIWKLDGNRKSQKEILEHVHHYRIQVDNLCQFLPQDRVASFAKMNKQELLKQTQIALCRTDLIKMQEDLISKRERHKYLINNMDKYEKKLEELKSMNLRMEGKVENFNKRKKFLEKIDHITRKEKWLNYLEYAERRNEVKGDRDAAQEVYKKLKDKSQPLQDALANARVTVDELNKVRATKLRELNLLQKALESKKENVGNSQDAIRRVLAEKKVRVDEIESRQSELSSSLKRLEVLMRDLQEMDAKCGTDTEISRKMEVHNTDLRKVAANVHTLEEAKNKIIMNKQDKMKDIGTLEGKLRGLENVKSHRLDLLRRKTQDAYTAVLWLRENQHLFKSQVYEPIMLEVNVHNPNHALYLEQSVGYRDKIAFTCTDKEDMTLLIRTFKTMRLTANVVYSHPDSDKLQPKIPIENLRRFGFSSYLSSLFTAPGPIMSYLCRQYSVHNIPIAFSKTNGTMDGMPPEIRLFYRGSTQYNVKFSKYSKAKSTRQMEISSDQTFSFSVDQVKINNLNGHLENLRLECTKFDDNMSILDAKIREVNQEGKKIREMSQELSSVKQQRLNIISRMRVTEGKVEKLRNDVENTEDVEKEFEDRINEVISKMLRIIKEASKMSKTYSQKLIEIELDKSNLELSRKHITELENKSMDIIRKLNDAEDTLRNVREQLAEITRDAKTALQQAKTVSNGFTPEDEGFAKFRKEYDSLPDDIEELIVEKDTINSKIDCLVNAADAVEMEEYEKRKETIGLMEEDIVKEKEELDGIGDTMERMQQAWLEPLQIITDDINERFKTAFKRMDCAGEVEIYKGENDKDYNNYGLTIKVTYRNGEPLQELNNITQSGGERAVATAAFMLSLQELTPVPFRCVDEINQGMDNNNERRIFELMVECTSQPDTSQYFLITPKLIPNLKFTRCLKMHVVHNGPFTINQKEWNRIEENWTAY